MDLLSVVIVLAVLGFALWLILKYIPMPDPFKNVIIVFVVLCLLVWFLRATGVLNHGPNLRM